MPSVRISQQFTGIISLRVPVLDVSFTSLGHRDVEREISALYIFSRISIYLDHYLLQLQTNLREG